MPESRVVLRLALLVITCSVASAQWERVETYSKPGLAHSPGGIPNPLQFYLAPSPDRDPSNSLCLGCKIKSGEAVSLNDFDVEASKQPIGESSGRKIVQIILSFHVKKGSVTDRMHREWEEGYEHGGQEISLAGVPPVEWKSIVMESSPDRYKELYLLIDDGPYVRPLSDARLLTVGGVHLLATYDEIDGNGRFCKEAYWVLESDGPWLLDFTPVNQEIEEVIPQGAVAMETGCWALSVENGRVGSPVQRKGAVCKSCEQLGNVIVQFKIDGHHVVPVSSSFNGPAPTP